MPRRNRNNKNNKPKRNKAPRRMKRPKRSVPRPLSGNLSYARMITNPCSAPLVHPKYGTGDTGILTKFHSTKTITLGAIGDFSNGYVVFFPEYHGAGATGGVVNYNGNMSIFGFSDQVASQLPTNSTATPLGTGADINATTGAALTDPAFNWINSTTVLDARTVSACMTVSYTGTTSGLTGRLGIIDGVPRDIFSPTPLPSPATMMTMAQHVGRMPLDTSEIIWKPSPSAVNFRTVGSGLNTAANLETLVDDCITTGIPAVDFSKPGEGTQSGAVTGICFVWQGLPTDGSELILDFYKGIEWRPPPSTGMVMPIPVSISSRDETKAVVRALDRRSPTWNVSTLHSAASAVSRAALAGQGIINALRPAMGVGKSLLALL
jgi:hypothetical protein